MIGDIGFSSNTKLKSSALIRFFTNSHYSHCFVDSENYAGEETAIEAHLEVRHIPFGKMFVDPPEIYYETWRVKNASSETIIVALDYIYSFLVGDSYGWLQGLWFVKRWFYLKLGKDISHEKNWFTDGVLCSELVYYYLCRLGPTYEALLKDLNPDTIQPKDIRDIFIQNPMLFEYVGAKE